MTTVQTMLCFPRRCLSVAGVFALAMFVCMGGGCSGPKHGVLETPEVLISPYNTTKGDSLWAVVPLANESGVSVVDANSISDALVAKLAEVRGITCLPLNRTLAAIRAMGNRIPTTPQGARTLANLMGVDALVLGSVTAYDPYNPPKIGMTLALFVRDSGRESESFDPIKLQTAYSDYSKTAQTQFLDKPASVVSEHLDGANHEVQMDLRNYATGRHDAESAMGWRGMMESMDLYTQFAAHHAVSRLLDAERIRLGQPTQAQTAKKKTPTRSVEP